MSVEINADHTFNSYIWACHNNINELQFWLGIFIGRMFSMNETSLLCEIG